MDACGSLQEIPRTRAGRELQPRFLDDGLGGRYVPPVQFPDRRQPGAVVKWHGKFGRAQQCDDGGIYISCDTIFFFFGSVNSNPSMKQVNRTGQICTP